MGIYSDDEVFGSAKPVLSDDQVFGPPQNSSIRFMDAPTGMERFLAGIKFPEWMDNLRGTAPVRVLQGAADPMIGAMQAAANLLPDSTGIPQAVNKRISGLEKDYEQQRAAHYQAQTGNTDHGFDAMRLLGNVVSPVNAVPGAGAMPAGAGMRALAGAGIGAVGALTQPVADDQRGYWLQKVPQVMGGAAVGTILTPVLGAVGDRVVRMLSKAPAVDPAQTDAAIASALQEMGQTIHDIPPAQLDALRNQVNTALEGGKTLDAAAALRKADFDALGMPSTLGQITRDPMQFARERNLRGIDNLGEPLSARFAQQGNQLQAKLGAPAEGAQDAYNAGNTLLGALKSTDDALHNHVTGLYKEARASTGKDLEVPLQGLAQDYADILRRYGPENLPSAVRSRFASLGMDPAAPGNQTSLFTLEDANQFLQNINRLDPRYTNPAMSSALGELRSAVKGAVSSADATGGPFAPAVKAASGRFRLQEAVPALEAASQGSVAPDDFVRRFIINGKTDDVKGLSQVLKQASPQAWQEARAQIADTLKRAAFGENVTGDKPFAAERYAAQIRKLGVDKLGAFFTPEEVQDILRVSRVGAYIGQAPNAAAVSSSNSQAGLINVMANAAGPLETAANLKVPGAGMLVTAAKKIAGPVKGVRDVRNALAADIPSVQAPLGPEQRNYLAYIMGIGGLGSGAMFGTQRPNNRVERRP